MSYLVLFILCLLLPSTAQAQADRAAERGRVTAQTICARCHAVGPTGNSPLPEAPPFRILHERYPIEDIEEALAEGIKTTHPMPEFQLAPAEINDLLAYLKSLEH